MKISNIVKGTLILTLSGVVTRFLGFYFRIFLTDLIGAEGLGLYQLTLPLIPICMSISCSGISLAISRHGNNYADSREYTVCGLTISGIISILCSLLIYNFKDFFAIHFFKDTKCSELIGIMAYMVPLSCIHNCITAYYIGISKTHIPAIAQLLEQICRILSVYLIFIIGQNKGFPLTPVHGIMGLLAGELVSALFSLTLFNPRIKDFKCAKRSLIINDIIKTAVPVSGNRIILSIFHSFEAVLIPLLLCSGGHTRAEALTTLGTLTGMALPIIMLPSTLINSFSTLLLPSVSGHQNVTYHIITAFKCSLLFGIFCLSGFVFWGNEIGYFLFKEELVGKYVCILGWLCPFLYLCTTLGSIINGMGKTNYTLYLNVSSLIIRIILMITLIPKMQINGYLIAFLVSEIYLSLATALVLYKLNPFSLNMFDLIIIPVLAAFISCGISLFIYQILPFIQIVNLVITAFAMLLTYIISLRIFTAV